MKKFFNAFPRITKQIVSLLTLLSILSAKPVNASDLITSQILSPAEMALCYIALKPQFIICNINIFDAQADEWTVHVLITKDGGKTIVFEETVDGVFLAKGSESNPTCVTLETVNEFIPEEVGVYTIEVDVDYIYDINPENDVLVEEFTVECPFSSIRGQKFEDYNSNGIKDVGEIGLDGVTIELRNSLNVLVEKQETFSEDLNGDSKIDPETESGLFLFDSLTADIYELSEVVPNGWEQTFPPPPGIQQVDLLPGTDVDGILFGNAANALYDFGDLPDPLVSDLPCAFFQCYPTLLPLGARHPDAGPFFGNTRDVEPNGQPTITADGDDTLGVNDEDGIKFTKFDLNGTGEVEITVNGLPNDFPAFISGWIDFDENGNLSSGMFLPNERIINAAVNGPGVYTYTFSVPANLTRGGYARFRISSCPFSVLFSFGSAIDGEVEDYTAFGLDFGDANEDVLPEDPDFPRGYPVKILSNGARHVISPLFRLGDVETDHELNGVPTFYANGDDNDNREDENGIEYSDGFFVNYSGPDPDNLGRTLTIYGMIRGETLTITPLASKSGLFNMWLDWNRDGDWKDDGEQIFDDEPILGEPNYTPLTFTVPDDASIGYTYARYRYSTQTGLEYYGGAPDGEVEDHLLLIDTVITGLDDELEENIPSSFELSQNYPNPFSKESGGNPGTTIKYSLPVLSSVAIKIYNSLGETVAVLVNEVKPAGEYEIFWNPENMASGVYFYSIEANSFNDKGGFKKVRKMVLLR